VAAFNRARVKYSGGKVGDVINLILITVVLMFLGDYVLLLEPYLEDNILFTLQTLFRTTALSFLAYGNRGQRTEYRGQKGRFIFHFFHLSSDL
jgi:hypothetical protein